MTVSRVASVGQNTVSLPSNAFKNALVARNRSIGGWLTLASPMVTEIMAELGFDWLLLDMEHSPVEVGDVAHHLRAAARAGVEVAVRPPSFDPVTIKRLLDLGVTSLVVPMISSAAQARDVVAATRYPPRGIRGVAGTTRASFYGTMENYLANCAATLCVVVQLETPEAIADAAAIAAIDGIDGVFIGPNDLAAAMGHLGQPRHPEVHAAIMMAAGAIRGQNKAAGILEFNVDGARDYLQSGFDFVSVGGDASLLVRAGRALIESLQSIRTGE